VKDDFRERLSSRVVASGLTITPSQLDQLERYYRLLVQWNRTINLSAYQLEPIAAEGLDRLFVESLAAARLLPEMVIAWSDIGSGGGSPAIPLKIVRPMARLTMVEVRSRKAAFLREVARQLDLVHAEVACDRFERLAERSDVYRSADLLTVRAVRATVGLIQAADRVLKPSGRLLVFGSDSSRTEWIASPFVEVEESIRLAPTEVAAVSVLVRT